MIQGKAAKAADFAPEKCCNNPTFSLKEEKRMASHEY